jgi:hypothetical protein
MHSLQLSPGVSQPVTHRVLLPMWDVAIGYWRRGDPRGGPLLAAVLRMAKCASFSGVRE